MARTKKKVVDLLANLPPKTQWLLDFANLGKKQGKLSPPRFSEKPKREPKYNANNMLPDSLSKFREIDKEGNVFLHSEDIKERGFDENGSSIYEHIGRKVTWLGNRSAYRPNKDFPLKEFKEWVLNVGLPPSQNLSRIEIAEPYCDDSLDDDLVTVMTYSGATNEVDGNQFKYRNHLLKLKENTTEDRGIQELLARYQLWIKKVLEWIIDPKDTQFLPKGFLKINSLNPLAPSINHNHKNRKEVFEHSTPMPSIPKAVWAYLLDFWVNQQNLCKLLKACPTCGRFFFKEGKMTYCCTKCKTRFNLITRESDAKRKRDGRTMQKEKLRSREETKERWFKEEEKKYRDYFNALGYSQEAINGVIDNILYGDGLSFEEGLKKYQWGKRR